MLFVIFRACLMVRAMPPCPLFMPLRHHAAIADACAPLFIDAIRVHYRLPPGHYAAACYVFRCRAYACRYMLPPLMPFMREHYA